MKFDFLLVDGRNLLFRSTWANQALSWDDSPTGGIYGFFRTLLAVSRSIGTPVVEVCWEGKTNWRFSRYEGYKSNRGARTDRGFDVRAAVASQQPRLQNLLQLAGIRQTAPVDGECDDAIYTRARELNDEGLSVAVLSQDRDLYQALECPLNAVVVVDREGEWFAYQRASAEAELGVTADKFVAYKALAGDSSDTIPGVPRIGPKTAVKLLANHTLSELLVAARTGEGWPGTAKQREQVAAHVRDVQLFVEIVQLQDTELELVREFTPAEPALLREDLEDLGMTSLSLPETVDDLCDLGFHGRVR